LQLFEHFIGSIYWNIDKEKEMIKEFSMITITNATWAQVVDATMGGFANVPQNWSDLVHDVIGSKRDATVDNIVVTSECPGFGAWREWRYAEGVESSTQPKIMDSMGGCWRIFTPENLAWAVWGSGYSGSEITVERKHDRTGWTITGKFPIIDGIRYEGGYFDAFTKAVKKDNLPEMTAKASEEIGSLRIQRMEKFMKMFREVIEPEIVPMDNFQNWANFETHSTGIKWIPVYATTSEIERTTTILTANGWSAVADTRYNLPDSEGGPIRVLVASPPASWDDEWLPRLKELTDSFRWPAKDFPYGRPSWDYPIDVEILRLSDEV
jgi:hypothetical protein